MCRFDADPRLLWMPEEETGWLIRPERTEEEHAALPGVLQIDSQEVRGWPDTRPTGQIVEKSDHMSGQQFNIDYTGKVPPEAQAKIADGMKRADDSADYFWKRMVDGCVLAAARRLAELTVDDVLAELEKIPSCPSTHNLAALGPAMNRAAKDRIVVATEGFRRSARPEKHGNLQRIWRSRYYGEK